MESRATARFVRVPPRKARLVVDMIRGEGINRALNIVKFTPKHAARVVEKVLRSALANAQHNHGVKDVDRLFVKEAIVDQGPTWKRIQPRAMGRAYRIKKRTSHITIVLQEHQPS
ncbi:MAG: 50S ribosomal protein L22 [candidate division NC10 bacterium]|nr:50S ribosomal protein L22 [candidate division NC10 bacterium]